VAAGQTASLRFTLTSEHFPCRFSRLTTQAKQMHLFFTSSAAGDVALRRNDTLLQTTQLTDGTVFKAAPFAPTGNFELQCDSNDIDELRVALDWAA
jgi:hypothetical protein